METTPAAVQTLITELDAKLKEMIKGKSPFAMEEKGLFNGQVKAFLFAIACLKSEDTCEEALEAIEEEVWETKYMYREETKLYKKQVIKAKHDALLIFLAGVQYQWNALYQVYTSNYGWVDREILHNDIASLSFDEIVSKSIPGEEISLFENAQLEPIRAYTE